MKIQHVSVVCIPFLASLMSSLPLAAEDWGDKMIEQRQIKFGHVARLSETTFNVTVKNPFQEAIQITSLTTSCGCISWVDQLPISIPSKAVRELTIRLDTVRHSGEKHVKAFVKFNEPTKGLNAVATLSVEGRIRDDFEVQPGSIGFGAVEPDRGSTQRLSVKFTGRSDWKISAAAVESAHFTTKIVEQSRTGGTVQYDIIVGLKPDAPIGLLRDRLILTTNEVGGAKISIPVEAKVEADIVVTDAHFGSMSSGTAKSVTVILRGKKAFEIEKVEHVSAEAQPKVELVEVATTDVIPSAKSSLMGLSHAFRFEFAPGVTQVHMLTLTMTSPIEPGKFDENFAVTIQGRRQPIKFRATGRIVDQAVSSVTH